MPVYVDLQCSSCGAVLEDQWSDKAGKLHFGCHGHWERLWTLTKAPSPGGNHLENAVVYVSAKEGGKVQYPGRTDAPVPERLRQRGYEKITIAPSQMGSFEKRYGVMNERRHYDRNGKTD